MAWHKVGNRLLSDEEYYGTPEAQLMTLGIVGGFVTFAVAAGLITYFLIDPAKTATATVVAGVVGVVVACIKPRPFALLVYNVAMLVMMVLALAILAYVLAVLWWFVDAVVSNQRAAQQAPGSPNNAPVQVDGTARPTGAPGQENVLARVKIGMNANEVHAVLGEPTSYHTPIEPPLVTIWQYPGIQVHFTNGLVDGVNHN